MFTPKNKYCCENFSTLHKQPVTSDCIRIIEIKSFRPDIIEIRYSTSDSGKRRFIKGSSVPYRFFIMPPLTSPDLKYSKLSGGYMISFCPFCGANLYVYYVKERNILDYINEVENETVF